MEKCCCCLFLRTGAILIAIWELIFGIIGILLIIAAVNLKASLAEVIDERPTVDNKDIKWLFNPEDVEESITHLVKEPVWKISDTVTVVWHSILILFGLVLMLGIIKNSPSLMQYWIIGTIIGLAFFIVQFILGLLIWGNLEIVNIFYSTIQLALQLFFIKVVYGHRKDTLKCQNRRQGAMYELKPMTVVPS